MIEGIAQVIGQDLLHPQFIPPYLQRRNPFIGHLRFLLIRKDLDGGQLSADQLRDVKAFHPGLFSAEFQLVQRQELFHHGIHLGGFIHDHITVELPALLIIIDALLQALRISLDQGKGRLELMGNI